MDVGLWLEPSSVMSSSQEGQAGFGEVLLEGISMHYGEYEIHVWTSPLLKLIFLFTESAPCPAPLPPSACIFDRAGASEADFPRWRATYPGGE